jgi:transposase
LNHHCRRRDFRGRRVVEQPTRFIGMDVHKDTIVVAVTAAGDVGKATPYGTFPNTAAALEKLVKRLQQAGSGPMKFCYEAGPCGGSGAN